MFSDRKISVNNSNKYLKFVVELFSESKFPLLIFFFKINERNLTFFNKEKF